MQEKKSYCTQHQKRTFLDDSIARNWHDPRTPGQRTGNSDWFDFLKEKLVQEGPETEGPKLLDTSLEAPNASEH